MAQLEVPTLVGAYPGLNVGVRGKAVEVCAQPLRSLDFMVHPMPTDAYFQGGRVKR